MKEIDACWKGTKGCFLNQDHTCEQKDVLKERVRLRELAAEERLAWDRYASVIAAQAGRGREANEGIVMAATAADRLLEERRKRFGAGK